MGLLRSDEAKSREEKRPILFSAGVVTVTTPTCSGCESTEGLHLVVAGRAPGDVQPGRLLVYCPRCRQQPERTSPVSVSIPLSLVTVTVFLGIFRLGLSESDPGQAVALVFGEARPEISKAAIWAIIKARGVH